MGSVRAMGWAGLLALVGCGEASLGGAWSGSVNCGEGGTVQMGMDVEDEGPPYPATAQLSGLYLDGMPAQIDMVMDLRPEKKRGSQVVAVAADCLITYEGVADPVDLECGGFDALGWDGESRMQAKVSNFMDTSYSCVVDLKRVGE